MVPRMYSLQNLYWLLFSFPFFFNLLQLYIPVIYILYTPSLFILSPSYYWTFLLFPAIGLCTSALLWKKWASFSEQFLWMVQIASVVFQNHIGIVSFGLLLLALHFVVVGFQCIVLWEDVWRKSYSSEDHLWWQQSWLSTPGDALLPQDTSVWPAIRKALIPADWIIIHALPFTYSTSS